MFDPEAVRVLLGMPADTKPIAILCLGHVEQFCGGQKRNRRVVRKQPVRRCGNGQSLARE